MHESAYAKNAGLPPLTEGDGQRSVLGAVLVVPAAVYGCIKHVFFYTAIGAHQVMDEAETDFHCERP